MKVRIFYHHTDCGGVVYYANYLKFLEEARTEFFEKNGVPIMELIKKGSFLFVVARQEIDYESPAFYGDILHIDTWINNISRVKIEFEYVIKNQDGKTVAKAKTALVSVNKGLKPAAIPGDIKEHLPVMKGERAHG